jgi:hypothetical protein
VQVAFHFAFAAFSQDGLLLPAGCGLLVALLRPVAPGLHAVLQPLFGLAISLWATAFLEAWRLHQVTAARPRDRVTA